MSDTTSPLEAEILATFPSRESFAILEPLGARYAVFHVNLIAPNVREALARRLDSEFAGYLRPLVKDDNAWLYEIVSWPR